MKRLARFGLFLASATAGAIGVAHADQGLYGRADLGWTVGGGLEGSGLDAVAGHPGVAALNPDGYDGGASQHLALGYAFGHWRLEGEIARRAVDLDRNPNLGDGDITAWSGLANALFDFNPDGAISPYLGAGIGWTQVDLSASGNPGAVGARRAVDGDDSGFSYQLLAGIGVALTERATLDFGYRYLAAPGLEYDATRAGAASADKLERDFSHHAATIGLRFAFGAPVPPPAPVEPPPAPPQVAPPPAPPVPCAALSVTVFFPWDSVALGDDARAVLDQAMEQARQCNLQAAQVVGHADRSGPVKYNLSLSERRATVVRDALVARGVESAIVVTNGMGEGAPAVATPDGRREPLNRRAEVTITFR